MTTEEAIELLKDNTYFIFNMKSTYDIEIGTIKIIDYTIIGDNITLNIVNFIENIQNKKYSEEFKYQVFYTKNSFLNEVKKILLTVLN